MSKVYHYTKIETAIEHILPKMELQTNFLNGSNDPKENQRWTFGGWNLPYQELYPDTYSTDDHYNHVRKLGNEIRDCCQFLSFVKDQEDYPGYLNEMMWAHYGSRHRGICLEIDKERLIKENSASLGDYHFREIEYGSVEKPYISWNSKLDRNEAILEIAKHDYKELFFSKSIYWEREYEERLAVFSKSQVQIDIGNSLTGIYFGLESAMQYLPAINNLINRDMTTLYKVYFQNNKIMRIDIPPKILESMDLQAQ